MSANLGSYQLEQSSLNTDDTLANEYGEQHGIDTLEMIHTSIKDETSEEMMIHTNCNDTPVKQVHQDAVSIKMDISCNNVQVECDSTSERKSHHTNEVDENFTTVPKVV